MLLLPSIRLFLAMDCRPTARRLVAGRRPTEAYFAAGVGGAITGRRAGLAIIDDPVRSHEDAENEVTRNRT
jgi:hypothetical protein